MSRIAKAPITVPAGVEFKIDGQHVSVKGGKGTLELDVHPDVALSLDDGVVTVKPADEANKAGWAMAGTMRALINNMVVGASEGFQKKLQLVGVGYRAQSKVKVLNLSLGFSHPVDYEVPEGITIETPSQTEVVVSGSDKQKVGQVAAEIRSFRPPEPYKGKGVRYADERIIRKEAKKK
jgi:large subunit ribosomal protein L6